MCLLWAAGADNSGFPAAFHWYLCPCVYFVSKVVLNSFFLIADKPRDALCKCNGVANLKHTPPILCYHAEFVRSVIKGVQINTESPKLGSAETPLSWDNRHGWHQDTRPSPACYHIKFGSSKTIKGHRCSPRHTWLGHHFQGQKVNLQGAGAYCGGLPHSLLITHRSDIVWTHKKIFVAWAHNHFQVLFRVFWGPSPFFQNFQG